MPSTLRGFLREGGFVQKSGGHIAAQNRFFCISSFCRLPVTIWVLVKNGGEVGV